jgi:hypothetical protein
MRSSALLSACWRVDRSCARLQRRVSARHAKSPKVRSFVDFLVQRLNFDTDYMEVLCPNRKCYETALPAAAFEESGADAGPVERPPPVGRIQKEHSTKMPRRRSVLRRPPSP